MKTRDRLKLVAEYQEDPHKLAAETEEAQREYDAKLLDEARFPELAALIRGAE